MKVPGYVRIVVAFAALAALVLDANVPAAAVSVAGLHYLVGSWACTYRAGAQRFPYAARYAYDRDGHTLRETTSWTGGGDEELIGYSPQRGWTAVVFEDQGAATILRAPVGDPNHIAYHSIYPDASIAETIDHVSSTEYTIHATVRAGGKSIASVDTCLRGAP